LPAELSPDSIRIGGGGLLLFGTSGGQLAVTGFRPRDGAPMPLPADLERVIVALDAFSEPVLDDHGALIWHEDTLYGWVWADVSAPPLTVPMR